MSPSPGDVEMAIAVVEPIVKARMRKISRAIALAPPTDDEDVVRNLTQDLATLRFAWDMLCRAARQSL